jgi:hypothetical protein
MNNIKKGLIVSAILLSQILLSRSLLAVEEYNNTNEIAFSEAELAQILAPIALYPDSLLTHVVIASTYPLEVVEAFRWREKNSELESSEAVDFAQTQGWDPSVTALVAFPNVLARLNNDIGWTQSLGNAFLEDEERVLDTIQVLRKQAMQANSLDNLQNMTVTKVNQQIIIQPAQKEVIYVPYYDTRIVYGDWYWNRHPPIYWTPRSHFSLRFPVRVSGLFHWNRGINISFNYHFSAFKWASRHIVVTSHHKTRRYLSHHRIASSNGAKRWQHKPSHRRGIAYRSDRLNSHYYGRKSLTQTKRSIKHASHFRKNSKFDNRTSKSRLNTAKLNSNKRSNHRDFTEKLASNNRHTQSRYKEKRSTKERKYLRGDMSNRPYNRSSLKLDKNVVEGGGQAKRNRYQEENRRQVNRPLLSANRSEVKGRSEVKNKKMVKEPRTESKKKRQRKRAKD